MENCHTAGHSYNDWRDSEMLRRESIWMLLLLIVFCVGSSAYAQHGNWTYLGNARVDGRVDHDSIRVTRANGTFRAIQLRVHGGAVQFNRVIVRYGNGSQDEVAVRNLIPSGGKTRAIDLPGDRRIIQSVELWYAKANWRTRPTVSLYGMR